MMIRNSFESHFLLLLLLLLPVHLLLPHFLLDCLLLRVVAVAVAVAVVVSVFDIHFVVGSD